MLVTPAKRKVRFTQLDAESQARLRTLYHLTSVKVALSIAKTGYIWSNDPDGCPNFSVHRDLKPEYCAQPEVALTFRFLGMVNLLDEKLERKPYDPNTLNLHLSSWPVMYGKAGMRVAVARVAAGTAVGLRCVNFKLTPAFMDKCKVDPEAKLQLQRLRRQLVLGRAIRVPASMEERLDVIAKSMATLDAPVHEVTVGSFAVTMWHKLTGRKPAKGRGRGDEDH